MNRKLILVISFCEKDKSLVMETLNFLREIGFSKKSWGKGRRVILAHNRGSNVSGIKPLATTLFEYVEEFVPNDQHEHGWPQACNHQFVRIAQHLKPYGVPWLFLEGDAAVLNPDFLDVLEEDYYYQKKPFLGRRVILQSKDTEHLTGVSVYPPNALELMGKVNICGEAWDYQKRDVILPQSAETLFIQQIWQRASFTMLLDLADIHPNTRIFHQCKDASLYKLIRRQRKNMKSQLAILSPEDKEYLHALQQDNIRLHKMLKEVLALREGVRGRNPRFAIRDLDAWIIKNRNLI